MENNISTNDINNSIKKKIAFSAVQPTGMLTIGNYIGAIKSFVEMQDKFDCYFAVADLHSLTVGLDGALLRKNILSLFAMFLACGIDPDKCTLFCQSHVAEHSQLAWVLNCYTGFGDARRMTQFKDKSEKYADNINVGLFAYPILQAADILLYNANIVPIGKDQKQHLELSRDIAMRFNNKFSDTFNLPETYIKEGIGKINSLQNPDKKMSKSDENDNAYILLSDTRDVVLKKFKRAVTDSDNKIIASDDKPGIKNLINIYSAFLNKTTNEVENIFANKSYADFKESIASIVWNELEPIQKKYNEIIDNKAYLLDIMKVGAEKARFSAKKMISKVYRKVGILELK